MQRLNLKELSEILGKEVREIRLNYDDGEALEVIYKGEKWPHEERRINKTKQADRGDS